MVQNILEEILQSILDRMVSEKLYGIGRELDNITKDINMSDSDSEDVRIMFVKMGRISCERFFTKVEERNKEKAKKKS